jgi:hypothetical protein
MGEQLGANRLLQGNTPEKWTKPIPSFEELAEQYFDLQCLRQYVQMAEANQTTDGNAPGRLRPSRSLS